MQDYRTPQRRPQGPQKPQKPQKRHRRRSFGAVMLTILLCALLCLIGIFAAVYFMGVRYIQVRISDTSYVKFLGMVDDEGYPYKGRIIYSDGISAEVNLDRNQIAYSNGDVYEGELNRNLLKEGRGKMLYANGDVYEGTFVGDLISGEGTYTYVNGVAAESSGISLN